MPKKRPEPFWRAERNCFYVQIGKKQVRLAPEEDAAWRLYHELMAKPQESRTAPPTGAGLQVVAVLDAYLEWAEHNREPRTYSWYRDHLQVFAESILKGLLVSELKPYHVTRAMDSHPTWGNNHKHNFARSVQRAFNWALRQELVDRNPVAFVEKPAMEARELAVTPADYERVIAHVADPEFRDLIRFAWESGVRPQEIRAIESRHVDLANRRIVFPRKESKGKKAMRVVYLTDDAIAILRPRLEGGPAHAFRNSKGRPWTAEAVNCAFCRLQVEMGTRELAASGRLPMRPKLPKKGVVGPDRFHAARTAYRGDLLRWKAQVNRLARDVGQKFHMGAFRKGYTTEALKNGLDTVTVAHLLGHKDAVMVSRVYAKVQQDPEFMAAAARRAKGGS